MMMLNAPAINLFNDAVSVYHLSTSSHTTQRLFSTRTKTRKATTSDDDEDEEEHQLSSCDTKQKLEETSSSSFNDS